MMMASVSVVYDSKSVQCDDEGNFFFSRKKTKS